METAAAKLLRFTRGMDLEESTRNNLVYDAVLHNLLVLGEAAKNVPAEVRAQHGVIERAVFSPDGERIAYLSSPADPSSEDRVDLYVAGRDFEDPRKIADLPPHWSPYPLRFTPDGSEILFVEHSVDRWHRESVDSALYAIDVATGVRRAITDETGHVSYFDLNAAGDRLVVGLNGAVALMDTDGGNQVTLVDTEEWEHLPVFHEGG